MKVVTVNGGPRMEKGYTQMILTLVVEDMTGAGADVDLFHTRRLVIRACIGDFSCWYQKPGL